MAEPLLRYLWMDAGEQELRRMAVAQIMEADTRNVLDTSHKPREFMRKAARLHRLAISQSTNYVPWQTGRIIPAELRRLKREQAESLLALGMVEKMTVEPDWFDVF
jgi:hypothetical protein